ncbi:MAG: phosphopyruvate hydratase [Pseudomonadota bacterium]|nr:phosphopyruvate hydratase [Pseudomonadota bacterium]
MSSTAVRRLHARQILDSRGRPTVEVDVELASGVMGRAAVPSGASTGSAEAHELRDGDLQHYGGLGVLRAVANVKGEIGRALSGVEALEQSDVDARLRELDGTANLARLGANAVLGVSMAVCRAAAVASQQPLYAHVAALAGCTRISMPLPMVNVLSGGLHAARGMDIQDFLAVPIGAHSTVEAIEMASRVRAAASEISAERGLPTLLADEGGLSPGFVHATDALDLMMHAFERAGLEPGRDIAIAMDVAATELESSPGTYHFAREGLTITSHEVATLVQSWLREYPIVSVEDPLAEDDWKAWCALTREVSMQTQLVGDDLFATQPERLARGARSGAANAVLIKLNQNGTVTGTLQTLREARAHGYSTIVSARSGETEDAFMADLAVGTAAGQIKIGSLRSSERLAKYNQLIRIEGEAVAPFAGAAVLAGFTGRE